MTDKIIQRVEHFCCSRGALFPERRNRGYTLCDTQSGARRAFAANWAP